MGYFGEKLDNNPLWGYKSELIEDIKDEKWREARLGTSVLGKFSISKEDWENAVEERKKDGQSMKHYTLAEYGDSGGGKPWTSNSMVINESGVSKEWERLPDKVKEKIKDWYESTGSSMEYSAGDGSFVEFRYIALVVKISNRGNPQDVYLNGWFKNH